VVFSQSILKSPIKALSSEACKERTFERAEHICTIGTLGERYMPNICMCGAVISLIAVISIP